MLIDSPSEAILTDNKNVGLSIGSSSGEGNDLRGTAQPNSGRNSQLKGALRAKQGSSAEPINVLDEAKRQLDFNEASMTPISKDNARAVETGEGDTGSPVRTSPRLRSSAKKKKQKSQPKNSVRSGTKRTIKGASTKEPTAADKATIQQEGPPMEKGDTVSVLSRTWPGVNKPGGAGRIWKVNEDGTYDIKYLLGGSERSVERQYITLTNLVSIAVERKRRPRTIYDPDTMEAVVPGEKEKQAEEEREKRLREKAEKARQRELEKKQKEAERLEKEKIAKKQKSSTAKKKHAAEAVAPKSKKVRGKPGPKKRVEAKTSCER